MTKILLLTPPLTQLNTAYPATSQLLGFLRSKNIAAQQADLSIELIEVLFCQSNLARVFELASLQKLNKQQRIMFQNANFYCQTIEPVVQYLSGQDSTLSIRFSNIDFWPARKRQPEEEDLEWAFGTMGNHDRATHLCTLFVKDIVQFISQTIDPHFELIKYAESLCMRLAKFDPLQKELNKPPTFIDSLLLDILIAKIEKWEPEYVGFSIPFPGNLYSALRCAQWLKTNKPNIKVVIGGGYVNTELRQITDGQIFDYIDFLTFDDGELPILRILDQGEMIRTLYRNDQHEIVRVNFDSTDNIPFAEVSAPDYDGLLDNKYLNTIDLTNPMHALWSNGKWNKMTLAHGCYWGKCAFCDGTLDYVKRFEKAPVKMLVDRIEAVVAQTGISGFHFVDEAAPPALLRQLAEEIIARRITISYWTNIRFEKSYTPELCYLLAKSGCIAIAGGLEVASPRILKMINKGITIESASLALKNLTDAGIMTHTYLMYGFPTQTAIETIDSLNVVRGLFEQGCVQSAFWHRYAMTLHSPTGQSPEIYGAQSLQETPNPFANNEIPYSTTNDIDHDFYGKGLNLATYNFMNGAGYDIAIEEWFKTK